MAGELPYTLSGETLLLRLKVRPNAGRNQIAGVQAGELVVRLQAQPRKGEANRALVRFLAKSLGLPRSAVVIAAGETSSHKLLRLPAEQRGRLEAFLHPLD
jgi:uncharacterized protein (TIGR00251 family)